ncbi:hypothetical protein ACF1A9_29130 [Streptomyces sp. NPDC014872]|uniref:hypothetical protein n=1 Tax=Streptomyces sp. NPDC014872 TaxID=3364926 RepID=UPI0036F9DBE3
MSKRPDEILIRVRQAKKELVRAGATLEQIAALELALLRQVQDHAEIGGNSAEYIIARVATLEGS